MTSSSNKAVFCAALLLLAGSNATALGDSEEMPNAMWVWDARSVTQPVEREKLLRFCRGRRIGVLYLSAYNVAPPADAAYREFNRLAHEQGIEVHALAGDPRWGHSRYHDVSLKWVEAVRRFNAQAGPKERFDGLHSDVEVYLLAKAWSEKPAHLLGGYLDLNAKIAGVLREDEEPIAFGVDIPFWFDDDPAYRILWNGEVKPPSYHVLDTVDFITVMAYRNFADGEDGTIQLVSLEMDYADGIGKKVFVGQETQENLVPAYVTFGGTSCASLYEEIGKVRGALGERPSFGGIAFHHYESFQKLCKDEREPAW